MKVKRDMMHPEVRFKGSLIRTFIPSMNVLGFRALDWLRRKKYQGKWKSDLSNFSEQFLSRKDGTKLRIVIAKLKNQTETVPGVLWLHGGGYVSGVPEQNRDYIDLFLEEEPCVFVAPDYMLATEKPYPAALDDCYETLLWMVENAEELGIDPDRIILAGTSAGGGLVAAVSLYARDHNGPAIMFQMPLYPMLDDRMQTASMKDNDAPVWCEKSNRNAWHLYLEGKEGTDEVSPYASPSRATNYTGLPPTISIIGTVDPFYDETLDYLHHLEQAGVPVAFRAYEGCFHGFDQMDFEIGREAVRYELDQFKRALDEYH